MPQIGRRAEATASRSTRPPRSTQTEPGPLTITSSTAGSREQRLERAEPEGTFGDHRRQLCAGAGVQQPALALDQGGDAPVQVRVAALGRAGLAQQPLAQRGGQLLQRLGVGHPPQRPRTPRIRPLVPVRSTTSPVRVPLAVLLAACLLALGLTASASARTTWLCRPGHSPNPCAGSLNATVVNNAREKVRIEKTKVNPKAPIDCFYVYPTVSDQQTTNADLKIDPQEKAVAKFQAARFSSQCRVWAPMYRQVTLKGILNTSSIPAAASALAYRSARSAWRDYLAHDNKGRGFVLLGHSQGSFVLRQLIKKEIDRRPSVRRRMVSALLLGGNVTVAKGKRTGGDFRNVPSCRRTTETGCVVAYSTFGDPPPADALFGRVPAADRSKLQVLCTNPGSLAGGSGKLTTYIPTSPFPGTLGVGISLEIGSLPEVSTDWIEQVGSYSGRCVTRDNATSLRITAAPGARVLPPVPDATWGLHLSDINIALGNLTSLVRQQAAAYGRGSR